MCARANFKASYVLHHWKHSGPPSNLDITYAYLPLVSDGLVETFVSTLICCLTGLCGGSPVFLCYSFQLRCKLCLTCSARNTMNSTCLESAGYQHFIIIVVVCLSVLPQMASAVQSAATMVNEQEPADGAVQLRQLPPKVLPYTITA